MMLGQSPHIEIYACPWCMGVPKIIVDETLRTYSIKCNNSTCPVKPGLEKWYDTLQRAANEWNKYLHQLENGLKKLNNYATKQQPKPAGVGKEIHEILVEDIRKRKELGRQRYGEPLKAFNGHDALMDAYQEALDLAAYLRQWIEEREEIIETLIDVTSNACGINDSKYGYVYDSMGRASYAEAIKLLARMGYLEIIEELAHDRIISKPVREK